MLDLALAAVLTAGGYDGGRLLCNLSGPDITESSGMVASSAYDDLLYTHNDSGDTARVFQLDRTCRARAVLELRGVQARDWEDMSRGPDRTLWLGDIGDNSAKRDLGLLVHRIRDPGPVVGTHSVASTAFRLVYEDGPQDAEALLVHPRTGQLLIVTKGFAGGGVYAAPLPLRAGSPNVLHRVGEVRIPEVTSGDISPDGRRVVLRNYGAAYEWDVRGDDVAAAMRGEPTRVALPRSPQGEAITYSRDGRSLIVGSEGRDAPLSELRQVAATPRPSTKVSREASRSWPVLALVGALGLVLGAALWRRRTRPGPAR